MVKPTFSEGGSPLEKWRRQKDKVLEADAVEPPVEPEDPPEDPPGGFKKPPAFSPAFPTMRGGSGDFTYLPIQAPPPKGEPTMIPIQSRPKGEATMMPGESRRRSADPTMMPGENRRQSSEATMMPGESRRRSADPTMMTIQSRSKGEATMMPGESRRQSADPAMMPTQSLPSKGEATMMPGESRRQSADPAMMPAQSLPSKGEATMMPGESRSQSADPAMMPAQSLPSKGEATMIPGESRRRSADPTMIPTQSLPSKGEATMMPGESRRRSADPTMVPIQAPPSKGEASFVATPGSSQATPSYESPRDSRAILESAINTFIGELRSAASTLGMDFSIIQPDALKLDFFTDSKALRVTFTGREQTIDRIVVREMSSPANTANPPGQNAGAGSARRQMLEWESGGMGAGQKNAKLDVATIRDANSGALDWNEIHAPEEIEAIAAASRVAMEAHYFDADDGRNWHIELVNTQPAPEDETAGPAPGPELTPEGARRLVMLLLNCLGTITRH